MIDIFLQAKLDPERAILRVLAEKREKHNMLLVGMNISQISQDLKISRVTVSKHCRKMHSNNKIFGKKLGRSMVYYARPYTKKQKQALEELSYV